MNNSIKEKWVEALRSGDYEQGEGALRQEPSRGSNKYCCLGVLCDVVEEEVEGGWREWSDATYQFAAYSTDGQSYESARENKSAEFLPRFVQEHAGLDSGEPNVLVTDASGERKLTASLTALNDGLDKFNQHSFDEIADVIERSL